jgi:hypothetical protein
VLKKENTDFTEGGYLGMGHECHGRFPGLVTAKCIEYETGFLTPAISSDGSLMKFARWLVSGSGRLSNTESSVFEKGIQGWEPQLSIQGHFPYQNPGRQSTDRALALQDGDGRSWDSKDGALDLGGTGARKESHKKRSPSTVKVSFRFSADP